MTTNLTLTLDEELVRKAEAAARERNTSVDEFVGNLFRGLPAVGTSKAEREEARRRIQEIFRTRSIELGPRTWTREDLHDRKL